MCQEQSLNISWERPEEKAARSPAAGLHSVHATSTHKTQIFWVDKPLS